MRSPVFRLAITKEPETSMAWSAKVFSASTPTVWRTDCSNIIRRRVVSGVADPRLQLQFVNCFADIVEHDVPSKIGSADAGRYNESDFSAFEFLIELERVEDLLTWKIWRQTSRQIKSLEKADDCVTLPRRQSGSFN